VLREAVPKEMIRKILLILSEGQLFQPFRHWDRYPNLLNRQITGVQPASGKKGKISS
jgi:hypothetical protein